MYGKVKIGVLKLYRFQLYSTNVELVWKMFASDKDITLSQSLVKKKKRVYAIETSSEVAPATSSASLPSGTFFFLTEVFSSFEVLLTVTSPLSSALASISGVVSTLFGSDSLSDSFVSSA
jgi:hypothetical protein